MFCMRYITVQFHWRLFEVPILVLQAVREIAIMCFAPFLSSFKWFCMRYITVHFHWRLFQAAGGIANSMFVCMRKSLVKDLNATDDGKECDENASFWVVVLNPWCKISGKPINFWADGLHSGCLDLKVYWVFFGFAIWLFGFEHLFSFLRTAFWLFEFESSFTFFGLKVYLVFLVIGEALLMLK